MVKLHAQNGLRLIDCASVLRALTFELGRYGLVHKSIPFWNIEYLFWNYTYWIRGIKLENTGFLDFLYLQSFLSSWIMISFLPRWQLKMIRILGWGWYCVVSSLCQCYLIWLFFEPVILQADFFPSSDVLHSLHANNSPICDSFFKFHYGVMYCSELLMIV